MVHASKTTQLRFYFRDLKIVPFTGIVKQGGPWQTTVVRAVGTGWGDGGLGCDRELLRGACPLHNSLLSLVSLQWLPCPPGLLFCAGSQIRQGKKEQT